MYKCNITCIGILCTIKMQEGSDKININYVVQRIHNIGSIAVHVVVRRGNMVPCV